MKTRARKDLDSDTYFGGLYLGHEMGASFIDLSLTAGWSDFRRDRKIANNLVAGGIEHVIDILEEVVVVVRIGHIAIFVRMKVVQNHGYFTSLLIGFG